MYAIWRFVSGLTIVLNRIVVLVISLTVCFDLITVLAGDPNATKKTTIALAWIDTHPQASLAIAGVLAILNLNILQFLLFSLVNAPGRAYIESKSSGGQSRVSLRAIQNALAATALQVPDIARSRIRVLKLGSNRYRVHIRYWVRNVASAGDAAEHLRLILKKRFSDLVVLDPKDRVEFDLDLAGIEGLVLKATNRRELPRPNDRLSDRPSDSGFKGPIYPVEGDNGP